MPADQSQFSRLPKKQLVFIAEKLVDEDLLEIKAVRVEAVIKGKKKSFDFLVKRNGIDDTLEKIMGWSLQEEEYEMCSRVKNLQEFLPEQTHIYANNRVMLSAYSLRWFYKKVKQNPNFHLEELNA